MLAALAVVVSLAIEPGGNHMFLEQNQSGTATSSRYEVAPRT